MSVNMTLAVAADMATALNTAIGSNPKLLIYTGAKPSTPETAVTGTLLATITLTGFTASSNVLTSNDPAAVTPGNAGTAGYARLETSGGTAIMDVDVTATGGGGEVQLSTTALTTGVQVDLGAVVLTVPGV